MNDIIDKGVVMTAGDGNRRRAGVLFETEADLQRHLIAIHLASLDFAADLSDFEPAEVS